MDKTQNPNNNEMVIDLVQLAKALWHRAWAIVLAMVIFGGAAILRERIPLLIRTWFHLRTPGSLSSKKTGNSRHSCLLLSWLLG